jgi:hypothetical protein
MLMATGAFYSDGLFSFCAWPDSDRHFQCRHLALHILHGHAGRLADRSQPGNFREVPCKAGKTDHPGVVPYFLQHIVQFLMMNVSGSVQYRAIEMSANAPGKWGRFVGHQYQSFLPGFIERLQASVCSGNFPAERFHSECFAPPSRPASTVETDAPFDVEIASSRKVLRIPADGSIAQVLSEAGAGWHSRSSGQCAVGAGAIAQ